MTEEYISITCSDIAVTFNAPHSEAADVEPAVTWYDLYSAWFGA